MRDYHRKTCEIRIRSESYDLLGTRSGEGEEGRLMVLNEQACEHDQTCEGESR